MWSDYFGPKRMCMTVHSIILYNTVLLIWYYWVSPIWSDLVIRVTPRHASTNSNCMFTQSYSAVFCQQRQNAAPSPETCSVGKRLASTSKQNRSAALLGKPPASNSKHLGEELSCASANKFSYFLWWKCSFRAINIYKSYKVMGHRWLTTQATSFFRV